MHPDDRTESRAEPLPEERAAETGSEDRRAEAEAILAESEQRVADAVGGDTPSDGADEHRHSEDTVGQ
ncbi:MAG: hypothetical protein H7Y15_12480 [Pseudonocardia sp.]|nr:hypothetical protein [Pseudonocardia sp.]